MSENITNNAISINELTARLQKAENIRAPGRSCDGVGVDGLAGIIFDQPTLRDVILFSIMK